MPLISLVITLIVVGILLYLVETYIPMDPSFKTIIRIIVIVATVLWLLNVLGVLQMASTVQVPRVR